MKRRTRREAPVLLRLGARIREMRTSRGMTLDEMARRAGLSKGLLSKIENFRTVPSLPALAAVAGALNLEPSELLRGLAEETPPPYAIIRARERKTVKRDAAVGFRYETLFAHTCGELVFESFVLTLAPGAQRRKVTTDGWQFLFVLQGAIHFEIGSERLHLAAGDALFFDGRAPHLPVNAGRNQAVMLVIYLLG